MCANQIILGKIDAKLIDNAHESAANFNGRALDYAQEFFDIVECTLLAGISHERFVNVDVGSIEWRRYRNIRDCGQVIDVNVHYM